MRFQGSGEFNWSANGQHTDLAAVAVAITHRGRPDTTTPAERAGRYAAMDGRAYLLRHEDAFDAIVLDAFAERTAMPAHLLTREFFALARSRLGSQVGSEVRGGGYLAFPERIHEAPPGRVAREQRLFDRYGWVQRRPVVTENNSLKIRINCMIAESL